MDAETTPGDSEEQSTCHMRMRGYEASWEPRVRRGGFIKNALKMAVICVFVAWCIVCCRLHGR